LRLLREILVCLLLVVGIGVGLQVMRLLKSSRQSTDALAKTVEGVDLMRVTLQAQLMGKYGLLHELTAAARESRKTIDVLQKTSLTERMKVAAFSDASIRVVNDLDGVVRQSEATVHSLQGAVEQLGAVSTALKVDAEAAKPVLDGATVLLATLNTGSGKALDEATAAVGDVRERVRGIEPIERNVDAGTKSLAETLGFIRDNFAPKKRTFWMRLADTATSGMFSVFLHWLPQRVHEVH